MDNIKKYLEGWLSDIIDYRKFDQNNEMDEDKTFWNIRKFIEDQVADILLIQIHEDKALTKEEIAKLPLIVRHYLLFSEYRGIKMYVFNTKDWLCKTAIGVFWWSTWRTNERYFNQMINDEKYKNITNTVSVKLTELLEK